MHLLWLLCSSRPNEIFSSGRERKIAAQLWAQLNGRAAHDLAHLAPVQHLGWVSGVKHRPYKPPLQAGYPEHGKTEFLWLHWRAHFRRDEFSDFCELRRKEVRQHCLYKSYTNFKKLTKTFSSISNTVLKRQRFSQSDFWGEHNWCVMAQTFLSLAIYMLKWDYTWNKNTC